MVSEEKLFFSLVFYFLTFWCRCSKTPNQLNFFFIFHIKFLVFSFLLLLCRLLELSQALLFLHETCKYAHGDIKPENVMLHENRPKLVDFGSSHQQKPNRAQFGTCAYWSPEAHKKSPLSTTFLGGNKSDMFALGVIYFIILTADISN